MLEEIKILAHMNHDNILEVREFIPISPRIKIHSFSKCTSPRFEARQSVSEGRLGFKD